MSPRRPRRDPPDAHEALEGFVPCVSAWCASTFAEPSAAQVMARPALRRGHGPKWSVTASEDLIILTAADAAAQA